MVTELVGVDHIRPAFGFLTMILGVGVTIGTPIGGMYRRTMNWGWGLNVLCISTLVNVFVDLLVFTYIAGTS